MTSAVAFLLLALAPAPDAAPCLRPTRAGTQVQGEVRICPGRYRIADPEERGVLIAASSGTRIDLSGVTLESGDSVPADFTGSGIVGRGVDGVSVLGGAVRGYRYGVRLEGGRAHRISGIDVSGSRSRPTRSTAQRFDERDRLDPVRPDTFGVYGGGVYLKGTEGVTITGVAARGAQNGIVLAAARETYVADNELTGNGGWAISLWRSAHNLLVRNRAGGTSRCRPAGRDCGAAAAAVLLREASDSNTIAENDLTGSDRGVLLLGGGSRPPVGNLLHRNDASGAVRDAFADFGGWGSAFVENRADSADVGFRLDGSSSATLRGNTAIGTRRAGVLVLRGNGNTVESNVLIGGAVGVQVGGSPGRGPGSRGVRIDDNVLGRLGRGIVLEQTRQARVRGNLFDRVGVGLTADGDAGATEVSGNVFLRATYWYIDAPALAAGGNYWATSDPAAAAARVRGRVTVLPWRPASAAGY